MPPSELIGQVIGNYRLLQKLGAGGMGAVYKAEDIRLGRTVALKLLLEASLADQHCLERFRRETRAASSLNHPHICTVYDAGEDRGLPFLVLELLEGETLARKIGGRPLPLEILLQLGLQICDGLQCAHEKGIVHRDLKPSNIFITERGDPKLLDFGLSKVLRADPVGAEDVTLTAAMTQQGQVLGTAAYMSPEQAQGQPVDARSDIFSLGAILYEMATGVRAFRGDSAASILAEILRGQPKPLCTVDPQLPRELQRIVAKALEKDPADRYQSAKELQIDLRRLAKDLSSRETVAPPDSFSRRPILSARTIGFGILATAVVVLALAVLLTPAPTSGPLDSQQLTFSPEPKEGPLFTDGARLYFTSGGVPSEMAVSGGMIAPMRILQPGMQLLDLSPDGSRILALKVEPNNEVGMGSMWVVPTLGGTQRRIGSSLALAACWSPDGRSLAFSNKHKLYISDPEGANAREIWTGPHYLTSLCFSPDSREIAATATNAQGSSRVWMVRVDGRDAHPLRLDWPEEANQTFPQWTPDRRHFLFMSDRESRSNVYEVVAPRWYQFWKKPKAVRLTGNQLDIEGTAPARDGTALFVLGRLRQGAMQFFDLRTRNFNSFLRGLPAIEFVISPDRKWMAYTEYPSGYLWKCRLDGSEKLQLTHSLAVMQQWSPDSKSLVFSDWFKLYLVSADGGVPEQLIAGKDEKAQEVAPTWSPDGRSIFFNYFPYPDLPLKGVQQLNLTSRRISTMPGSQGLYVPLWSPDGRHLVAIGQNPSRLMLYSRDTKTWSELKRFDVEWTWFVWANDSKSLYVSLLQGENGLYRLTAPGGKWEKLSDLEGVTQREPMSGFLSVTPYGQPAIMNDTGIAQIYSLRWK
ncbi:MAG TPA: protein kinase [Bryobacteraceae bacterium]|nr:protein kinase [Bryobacteraceae bacterium]